MSQQPSQIQIDTANYSWAAKRGKVGQVTHLEAVDEVDGLPRVARQHRLGRRQHVLADVLRRAGEHLARVALHVLAEGARDGVGRVLRRISAAKQEHNTTV